MNPTATRQWPTYLDYAEVIEYLQLPETLTTAQQNKLQRYIDSACTFAQNRANRPLGPCEFKERHDGWSGEYIQLDYSPFLQLVLCREWQSTGGFVTLPESTPENPVEGIQIDYGTSRIMRTFTGYSWPRPFFPGSRNVEVSYLAGFDPVPPDLWEATQELVAWKWRNTQQATRGWMASGQEFDQNPNQNDGLYPGVPNRIAEVFSSYWLPSIG
jgi:hypothetical protein